MSTLCFSVIMILMAAANAIVHDGPKGVERPEPPKGANGPSEYETLIKEGKNGS